MPANQTLSAMSPSDLKQLAPHLVKRQVKGGETLISQGARVREVYLPETALLTNVVTFSDGRSAEAYLTGPEGVGGLVPSLAGAPSAWSVQAKTAGTVYALPADVLIATVDASPTLRAQIYGLANDYQARAVTGLACCVLHTLTQRLASFILSTCDRVGSDELGFTQEDIAGLLNVQRTTVNAGARELKLAKAIRYTRGRIRVIDRAGLRQAACECYREPAVDGAGQPAQAPRQDHAAERMAHA